MDAEMNRKLSVVSPEEAETDTVKQEYGERMKKENVIWFRWKKRWRSVIRKVFVC